MKKEMTTWNGLRGSHAKYQLTATFAIICKDEYEVL